LAKTPLERALGMDGTFQLQNRALRRGFLPRKRFYMKAEKFATQNLYQASFLFCQGYKVLGTERDGGKVSVIFEGENVREKALQFYNGAKVDAKKYSDAYRSLKDMIFQR
jgi:hypothetical protein